MFVLLGDRVINLSNVTQIYKRSYDLRPCIQVDFTNDTYERFYPDSPEYQALDRWAKDQTHIKQYADVYTRIAVALEMLEGR